ncbi:MAG: UMP kinase [Mesoaciditoga sp.]|uniref:UMP kinase n=1 Tax=Athalassotoga sp. TaxID=2022597 RepID=UPI000CC8401D|nr:MAG: UMP kinase [Mesoaciditoga sp.]PMP79122.1 MAG: UMP kinase [Mesoaciditoga sp.]HEU24577.1 UMP kinase [Mesoaciditoga lauensis]
MYKRVLLKLSGEVLSGEGKKGIDYRMGEIIVDEIYQALQTNVKLGIVIGAGNLFRGEELSNVGSINADQIGMLGTVINSIYLLSALKKRGIGAVVLSKIIDLPSVEILTYDSIERAFQENKVVIFAGGTSNPLFTTDTAAALRAAEMNADVLIKGTKVDGVYSKDPKKYIDASRFEQLTFEEAINLNLTVMDTAAFALCKSHSIPIIVMDFFTRGNFLKVLKGERIGTLIFNK